MTFETATLQTFFLGGFTLCLIWAAVSDILTRKISNSICSAIIVIGFSYIFVSGANILTHTGTTTIILILGFIAFAKGWIGGGDAKLLAACTLIIGPAHLVTFLVYTALVGGGMALLWCMEGPVRYALVRGGLNVQIISTRQLPYGVAIATGGLMAAFQLATL